MLIGAVLTVVAVIALFFTIRYAVSHMHYRSIGTVSEKEGLTDGATKYLSVQGRLYRYSGDGVSLLDNAFNAVWNDSLSAASPVAVANTTGFAVYDRQGLGISFYNRKGRTGGFSAKYPIISVCYSDSGNTAMIVDNDSTPMIQYYSKTGELIADVTGGSDDKGYPVDLDVSADGTILAATFLKASEEGVSAEFDIYDFGGKTDQDHLLYSEVFEGKIIPDVIASGSRVVILEENGFTVYHTGGKVTKENHITFDEEIVSAFYDKETIGFILNPMTDSGKNLMRVYDIAGNLKFECEISIIYDDIVLGEGGVLLYNESEMLLYSLGGVERFQGMIDEDSTETLIPLNRKRYFSAGSTKIKIFELKVLDSDNAR